MLDTSRVNSRTISLLHPVCNCFFDGFYSSFADPGCLYRILSFSILTQILFLNSRKYDPGCSFRIRIPDPDPDILPVSRILGSKKAPDPDPQHCSILPHLCSGSFLFPGSIRDGWNIRIRIKIRIRNEQPGSHFRELRTIFWVKNNINSWRGSGIRDPGWKKFGSGIIRDGKNSDLGSGISILAPHQWLLVIISFESWLVFGPNLVNHQLLMIFLKKHEHLKVSFDICIGLPHCGSWTIYSCPDCSEYDRILIHNIVKHQFRPFRFFCLCFQDFETPDTRAFGYNLARQLVTPHILRRVTKNGIQNFVKTKARCYLGKKFDRFLFL